MKKLILILLLSLITTIGYSQTKRTVYENPRVGDPNVLKVVIDTTWDSSKRKLLITTEYHYKNGEVKIKKLVRCGRVCAVKKEN